MEKFILFSEQRTGSNYCLGIMSRNKDFLNLNELLNVDKAVAKPKSLEPAAFADMRANDPMGLIRNYIFNPEEWPRNPAVVGFKYQYQNLFNKSLDHILPALIAEFPEVKVVHLVRRNAFERYVSKLNAMKTSQYFAKDMAALKPAPDPYYIKIDVAEREMQKYLNDVKQVDDMLSPFKNFKTVYYEDLTAEPEVHFKPLFDMVGLEEEEYEARSQKQSLEPRFQVRNYAMLRDKFKGTQFESFFHEGPGY